MQPVQDLEQKQSPDTLGADIDTQKTSFYTKPIAIIIVVTFLLIGGLIGGFLIYHNNSNNSTTNDSVNGTWHITTSNSLDVNGTDMNIQQSGKNITATILETVLTGNGTSIDTQKIAYTGTEKDHTIAFSTTTTGVILGYSDTFTTTYNGTVNGNTMEGTWKTIQTTQAGSTSTGGTWTAKR